MVSEMRGVERHDRFGTGLNAGKVHGRRGKLARHVIAPRGDLGFVEIRCRCPLPASAAIEALAIFAHINPRQTWPKRCMKSYEPESALLGFFIPSAMKYMPAACKSFEACFSGSRKPSFSASLSSLSLMKPFTSLEEPHDGLAAVGGQLAANKVERLNAVSAFIDHRDTCIPDELLQPPFGW